MGHGMICLTDGASNFTRGGHHHEQRITKAINLRGEKCFSVFVRPISTNYGLKESAAEEKDAFMRPRDDCFLFAHHKI